MIMMIVDWSNSVYWNNNKNGLVFLRVLNTNWYHITSRRAYSVHHLMSWVSHFSSKNNHKINWQFVVVQIVNAPHRCNFTGCNFEVCRMLLITFDANYAIPIDRAVAPQSKIINPFAALSVGSIYTKHSQTTCRCSITKYHTRVHTVVGSRC